MAGRSVRIALALLAAGVVAAAADMARASGVAGSVPWYIDRFGGEPADLDAMYRGRVGVVMGRAPRPQLYMAWRLLHGQAVGPVAGAALSIPCCDGPLRNLYDDPRGETGSSQWLAARRLVKDAPRKAYTPTGREQPYYMWSAQCFDDAFRTAAQTLKARVAAHGAASPWVIAWLETQDAVFATCQEEVGLPLLSADAPAWLKADRAYQAAAHALYAGRPAEAAAGFGALSLDERSPWRGMGPYLKARALRRAALAEPSPERFTLARVAIADLSRRPVGTFGREEVRPMLRSLAFRDRPRDLMAELTADLAAPAASDDLAVVFRDAVSLTRMGQPPPEALDWIATLRPEVNSEAALAVNWKPAEMARLRREARLASQAHAISRWQARRSTAWLIAALALAEPGDAVVPTLRTAGEATRGGDPGWVAVQHHLIRLDLGAGDPVALRRRLDAILARNDLSASDRNLFTAQRAQVAADLGDFARFALRRRVCAVSAYVDGAATPDNGCQREVWLPAHVADSSVFDGIGLRGSVGLGEDARAIIDRMPLAQRIALSRHPAIPGQLRLDIAITSYARAVLLQDHAAIDGLAADLSKLLPQLAPEWRRIRETPVGPAKRFAEFFVLAKVPGIRADLVDYTRPEGTVAQFQYYWVPWVIVSRPVMPAPPPLALYQGDGSGVESDDPDSVTDLTCLGECGVAASPLRLPDFVAGGQRQALTERSYFVRREAAGWAEPPPPVPSGGVSVWDEMLAFARANPGHPQVPEALYWINRAGRWGGSHAQSGKRAFQLLHARYPKSTWAKRSPYYYD